MLMAHDLDPRLLRAFVEVVDRGGFSAAAAALHVTQPALSRRVGELESALGLRLFERTSRRVALTQVGEDLLARCRDLLAEGAAVRERARALAEGRAGILRIGCAPMIMESVVAPLIAQYRRKRPDVELQFRELGGARAQEAAVRGQLHAAVASPMEPTLQSKLLFPWRLLAVVREGHPVARGRAVDIARLDRQPILTLPAGFGTRALFDAACESGGVRPEIRMEAAAAQTLVAAARSGYGIAIVPTVLIMGRRGVRALPLLASGRALGRWLAYMWNPHRPQPSYLIEFGDLLAAAARRDYPGREFAYAPGIERPKRHRSAMR
jgi:DNA-binding transcriptional LysR family regulator